MLKAPPGPLTYPKPLKFIIIVYQYYRTTKRGTSIETTVFCAFCFYYSDCNRKFETSASEL